MQAGVYWIPLGRAISRNRRTLSFTRPSGRMFGKRKSHFCPYNVSIGAFDDGFAPSDSLKWQQSYEVVWPFREGGAPRSAAVQRRNHKHFCGP